MKQSKLKVSPKLNRQVYFTQPKSPISPISDHSKSTVTNKNYSRISNQPNLNNSSKNQISAQITNFIIKNLTKGANQQHPQLKDNIVEIEYLSNSRYVGQVIQSSNSQNIKNGLGIYYYSNKDVYFGSFKNDLFHGRGTYKFNNGQKFQGEFFQGSSIKGRFYYKNGNIYEGEYENNNPHGYGTMQIVSKEQNNSSSYFKGNWNDGKQNGVGQFQNNYLLIRGNWNDSLLKQAKIEFKKDYQNPQIHFYEGGLKYNQFEGTGKYIFNNSCHYSGEFKQGLFHGKGKIAYQNGDYYQGTFQYGKKNGHGNYYYKNGDTYIGQFYRDRKQGNGQIKFNNGDSYKGQFINDKIQGSGTYYWNVRGPSNISNVQFIGEFENGNPRSGQFYQNGKLIRKQLA